MLSCLHAQLCSNSFDLWSTDKLLYFEELHKYAKLASIHSRFDEALIKLFKSFNTSDLSRASMQRRLEAGNLKTRGLYQFLVDAGLASVPYKKITPQEFQDSRKRMLANPENFVFSDSRESFYPYYIPGRTYGYDLNWARSVLNISAERFADFSKGKGSETAVLVGNGPSLRHVDFSVLRGQDVFISNYAIKHPQLAALARGLAVTNHLVAEQEPYWFNLANCWKFSPFWLANSIDFDQNSISLNACGGELFFSTDVLRKVAWHSTVSFFWLQILFSAGYRKVVMIGFDNSYQQAPQAKEGDLIRQVGDDLNHFDPNYFKGKTWQAADTDKMAEAYQSAKVFYERDGREIVNGTVGGKLEVFRRGRLEHEIPKSSRRPAHRRVSPQSPKVVVASAFWKGDVDLAQLHWRLLSRLGASSERHFYLFKHRAEDLPPVNLPRVHCLEIETKYPESSNLPHPAGPNLAFVETLRLLAESEHTHFFWMEPDCIPTANNWLEPFLHKLQEYPEEPIIGTGGSTVEPGKTHWKNHFCGCSLYNIKKLLELDWESFIKNELHVSFDIWMSVQLGFIRLGKVNNSNSLDTIIYGANRCDWELVRKPLSLVVGMFEHWRPEKFLDEKALEQRLGWSGFSLFHAIKNPDLVSRTYKRLPKSASTIVINYNNGPFLKKCLESVLAQNCSSVIHDIIVVDDGSTDESRSIIESFGQSIKTVFLEHGTLIPNFNQQRALKAGLDHSQGEIIFLLDGDDVFYPTKIDHLARFFDDTKVVVAQHNMDMIDEEGQFMQERRRSFPEFDQVSSELYQKSGRVNWFQPTSGLCFHRAYLETQLTKLQIDEHENVWLDVRLTRFSPFHGKIVSSKTPLGAWRRHPKSDSIRKDNIDERVQKHERWYDAECKTSALPSVNFSWKALQDSRTTRYGSLFSGKDILLDEILASDSFAQANKLYREGRYAEALRIYEALAAREPLGIYRENAKMAKARLSSLSMHEGSGINS